MRTLLKKSRSVTFSVCADRCGRLRRPMRMSAPTDADVCVDRCGCLRRPMRMFASTDADAVMLKIRYRNILFCFSFVHKK
ncbi:hypothetical protein [Leyella stercorea]|uniref:hypothetical protein n=1 Tax=Leyella stercorea TaxID=363265 RepID=UPI0026DCD2A1|nr:hypothetical protein [Leyella stercorea]